MNVGEKKIQNDDTYGSYVLTCIGLIDLIDGNKEEAIDFYDVSSWMNKYHPKHFFGSFYIKRIDDNPWKFYVGAVLERDNKDWRESNPDCLYLKSSERGNKMPIAINDEKLKKWMIKSDKFLIDSIDIS